MKSKKLVLNDKAQPSKGTGLIQKFTCNLLPKSVRHDKMEGRDFLVVPMIILTEGVHTGSEGPLLYPQDELSKTPAVWNYKPVVVYHPEMNGVGISACDPSVISSRKVGVMMNTRFEKGKLKSEAWLETDRADIVDPRIMEAVNNNTMMELSTGVFVDSDPTAGEWKGENYTGIARNYRPDHLALLPDKIGACSISDGAGFLRNESGPKRQEAMTIIRKALQDAGLMANEMSHDNIRSSLSAALRKKLNVGDNGPFLWIADVYNDFVIYEFDGKLFRIGYTDTDTAATLDDAEAVPVVRVTEYRTVAGAFVGNRDQNQEPKMKKKKELIDGLIANSKGALVEADRPRLEAFTEEQLANFTFVKNEEPAPKIEPAPKTELPAKVEPAAAPVKNDAPVAPAPKKPITVVEYIDQAPKEVQDVLRNSMQIHEEEKTKLIDSILLNKNHGFTKEDLSNRPIGELRNLARLAAGDVKPRVMPNYSGQAPVTENTAGEEALAIPVLNFDKAAAK
jgi:Uncharacterized protein conserved in bacteria (DUF2213)